MIAGFSDLLGRQLERAATQPMIWAAASNAYARGADGFAIVEYHWTPNGWPWTSEEYETLRKTKCLVIQICFPALINVIELAPVWEVSSSRCGTLG